MLVKRLLRSFYKELVFIFMNFEQKMIQAILLLCGQGMGVKQPIQIIIGSDEGRYDG